MTQATPERRDETQGADPEGIARAAPVMARTLDVVTSMRRLIADRARLDHESTAARDAALAEADRELSRTTRAADERLAARLAQIDAEVTRATTEAEEKFARREARTREARQTELAQADAAKRAAIEKAQAVYKEAVWLADTVVESAEPRIKAQHETLMGELRGRQTDLQTLETQAAELALPATLAPAPRPDLGQVDDAKSAFDAAAKEAEDLLQAASGLRLPRMARGGSLPFVAAALAVGAAAAAGFAVNWSTALWPAVAGVGTLIVGLAVAIPLTKAANRQIKDACARVVEACARARALGELAVDQSGLRRDADLADVREQRNRELAKARAEGETAGERVTHEHAARAVEIKQRHADALADLESKRDFELAEIARKAAEHRADATREHEQSTADARAAAELATADATSTYERAHREMRDAWLAGMHRAREVAEGAIADDARLFPAWDDPSWRNWEAPAAPAPGVRLGSVRVDASAMAPGLPEDPALLEGVRATLDLPAGADLPGHTSILIESGDRGRDRALATMRVAMTRLLTGLPPGRARFTIVDPVGLGQSFAGFMRLTDHDPALVGARIWTEPRHIEQRLADLTEHMETVIQKYLRDEYATIEAYNEVAGEIAEPYRFLVVADFPANFTEDSCRRLASIADSGARCGVHTIILADPSKPIPGGLSLDDLRPGALVVRAQGDTFTIDDERIADLPLTLDDPAPEGVFDDLIRRVGVASQRAGRVEVPYRTITPEPDQVWTRACDDELRIPLGKSGATRVMELSLGRGTSQHALIAGKTGSGKSTLLHVMITTAALWHDPDQLEFYLVDFKKGVEFKAYADGLAPHVRAVAIESDREFGLSVLEKLDGELKRRGDMFRSVGVQSLGAYRRARPDERLPRTLLVIDEFQEFFVDDDKIAQEAALLLDRLVRQGRAFGIHVLLGSQTLSGAYTLARSTVGQMGVRIALQCSETDSYLILSEDNAAARLLSRPGEAIYNDAGGLVEGNTPFQTAWLSDHDRDRALHEVAALARERDVSADPPIVFEGAAAADLARNRPLRDAAGSPAPDRPLPAPRAWVGDPVAIKDPTGAAFRRRSGANLLIVGQQQETALGMISGALLSLAAQHAVDGPGSARFVVLDSTPDDDPSVGALARLAEAIPHRCEVAGWRDAADAIAALDAEVKSREDTNRTDAPTVFLLVHGVQRLRALRRKEDDFSFSMDDDAPASADKQLAHILREGPGLGIFCVCWCDTAANLARYLDRSSVGEFEQRVLMQMSASDSSTLIESASASRLGLRRAILHDDETGTEEKFRPYAPPDPAWAAELGKILRGRA
ncbi:MAG: FtsK/SpoIIIE domain-containing protein [Phycisphaerales bacterium]